MSPEELKDLNKKVKKALFYPAAVNSQLFSDGGEAARLASLCPKFLLPVATPPRSFKMLGAKARILCEKRNPRMVLTKNSLSVLSLPCKRHSVERRHDKNLQW